MAVVTGAEAASAAPIALHALLAEGYRVALAGRRADALEETRARGQRERATSLAVPTDVCSEASVRHLFEQAQHAFGRVDVLFNNAGRGARGRCPSKTCPWIPGAVWSIPT